VEESSGESDCARVGGIEAEEPDAWAVVLYTDVRAQVGLVKGREASDRRQSNGPHSSHGEWNQTEIRHSFEQIQL
jgi:hypothetical protein